MNDSLYRISLDIHSTQSQVSIPVTQFDTAMGILVTLTEGGKPYMLTDDCRAAFTGTKADGHTLYNDCIILNSSVIRYDFTEQTTAAIGIVDAAIKVFGADNKVITSPRLTLLVYEDTVGFVEPSTNEMNVIDKIVRKNAIYDADMSSMSDTLIAVQKDITAAKDAITQAQSDIEQAQSDIEQAQSDIEQAQNDIEETVSVSLATFSKDGWGSGLKVRFVSPPLTKGDVILLLPENEDTRKAASKARIYAKPETVEVANLYYICKPDCLTPTDVDLTFVELRFNDRSDTNPRVAIIGLNTTADDIDASIVQAKEEIAQAKTDIAQAQADIDQVKSDLEKMADTSGDDIPKTIDLSQLDNGEIMEIFSGNLTKTTTIEYDADGNPVKITDGDGNVTDLIW